MNNRLVQAVLSYSVLGLSLVLHSRPAKAVTIGSDTPDTLSFIFGGAYPPGNSQYSDGPLVTIFDGEYWQISAQSLSAPTGPAAGNSRLFVQQVIPGKTVLPRAVFGLSARSPFPDQQVSYQADSPAVVFNNVNCAFASPNCVFYELRSFLTFTPWNTVSFSYELRGFFQAPDSFPPVPEPSMAVGSFAALGLIAILRIKKRFA